MIVCVLYTRSLTRIYIGVYTSSRRRAGRHYNKTCVYANPFVPRFRHRLRLRLRRCRLSTSRRDDSFSLLASAQLRFLFVFPTFSPGHDFSRPSVRSFRIPECKRNAHAATEFESRYPPESSIARSKEKDRVLWACHFTVSPSTRSLFRCPRFVFKRLRMSGAIFRTIRSSNFASSTFLLLLLLLSPPSLFLSFRHFRQTAMKLTVWRRFIGGEAARRRR